MNRRQALMLCLSLPAAKTSLLVQEKQDANTGNLVSVISDKTTLQVNLSDKEDEAWGVASVTVIYKGKKLEFSAKEIWDALGQPGK